MHFYHNHTSNSNSSYSMTIVVDQVAFNMSLMPHKVSFNSSYKFIKVYNLCLHRIKIQMSNTNLLQLKKYLQQIDLV